MDFLNTIHIKYALTKNPIIYVSPIQQFWQTAAANTLDTRQVQVTTTIDGKVKLISEASIRRHLKLEDSDGISTSPNTEIFEQLALIGNIATAIIFLATDRTFNFSKMIFEGMGPILQGEGSTIPVESHHTPSGAPTTSQPPLSSPSRIPTGQETKVPLPSFPTYTYVANEAAFTGKEFREDCQDKQSKKKSKVSCSDDEEEFKDPSKQGRNAAKVHTYTKRRKAVNTGSDDIRTASRIVITAKESVSIAGASMPVSTVGMIDKGKGIMEEFKSVQTKIKRQQERERLGLEAAVRLQKQFDEEERQRIARVHEAAQTFIEKEWENIRARVEADEELTQRLQAKERGKYNEVYQAKILVDLINQRKKYFATKRAEERRKKLMTQAQQRTINDFVLMESEEDKAVPKLAEARSSKRDAEEELKHEGSKKQKTSEASSDNLVMLWSLVKERFNSTEPTNDKERVLWVELKRLFEPDTEDELWEL
uniref:Xylulose kinase-1 n=1 Tax=Tanacetum cinerariifolium TaxID=118510 RepID=A0A699IC80_TANCI|nr:hypothetical protein [Tanacetum cinerariifolium]